MLSQAVNEGKARLVRILLEMGRDANVVTPKGEKLIFLAISCKYDVVNRDKILRLLLKHGADVNSKNKEGRTPLMCEVLKEETQLKILATLIEHEAKIQTKDIKGNTALDYARKNGKRQVFEFIREKLLEEERHLSRPRNKTTLATGIPTRPVNDFHDLYRIHNPYGYEDCSTKKQMSQSTPNIYPAVQHKKDTSIIFPKVRGFTRGLNNERSFRKRINSAPGESSTTFQIPFLSKFRQTQNKYIAQEDFAESGKEN